jgi:integrase
MSKRGQNEGSIYKRPDGRWTSVINLGYQGGKLKRQYFYGKTHEEVAGKLTEALQKHRQGLPVAFERQTLGQFLDRWLEDSVKPSVRPNTYYSYEQNVTPVLEGTPWINSVEQADSTTHPILHECSTQRGSLLSSD